MTPARVAAWLGLLGLPTAAQHHLIGLGYLPYDPLCAESCLRSLSSYTLSCTPEMDMAGGHGGHAMSMTPPECFAADDAFLTVPASKLESFWEQLVTGSAGRLPAKWTYSEALAAVDPRPPSRQLDVSDHELNVTSVVNPVVYLMQWNVLGAVVDESKTESKYSLVIILVAAASPVLLSCFGYLPLVAPLMGKVRPYLVYPSLLGTYQVQPLPYYLGNAPTVGQGLYLAVFFVLNVVLSAVDYSSRQPNTWFASAWQEITTYVLYRTGVFAFVLLSPLLLFSSRNNILLWLTNWSHSTFILLHRWIGRLFMLYTVAHSIIGPQIYANYATTEWWIWGAVATVATVILTLASGLYVRAGQYELSLMSHIVLAVFVVVGCWYHLLGGSRRSSVTAAPAGRAAIEELADEERQMTGGETKSAALGHTARRQDSNNMAAATATGLTLFIKKGAGITGHLAPQDGPLALLDGPYHSNGRASDILRCDRVLVVVGGIGITGTLPWIYQRPNVKLAWSVAESARCLVEALDLDAAPEKEVKIGSRPHEKVPERKPWRRILSGCFA
ncbi:hypothetical protein RB596_004341 [Gaeumannomyces avenae]